MIFVMILNQKGIFVFSGLGVNNAIDTPTVDTLIGRTGPGVLQLRAGLPPLPTIPPTDRIHQTTYKRTIKKIENDTTPQEQFQSL